MTLSTPEYLANDAVTTLNGAITAAATSLTVTDSSRFPPRAPFRLLITGTLTAGGSGSELVLVGRRNGTVLSSLTRGAEAPYSTPLGFASGAAVSAVDTAAARYNTVHHDARSFGCKGDKTVLHDGAITTGTAALTSATAGFVAEDAGKLVMVAGAGASSGPLLTTIAAYVSATQVTLAANAATTVSGTDFSYGTDNTAGLQAMLDAAAGSIAYTPPGWYWVKDNGASLTSLLTIAKATTWQGAGSSPFEPYLGQTTIEAYPGTTKDILTHSNIDQTSDFWAHGTRVADLRFGACYGRTNPRSSTSSQAGTGGTLAAGSYSYTVTATTAIGETRPSGIMTVTVAAGTTNTVTVNWLTPADPAPNASGPGPCKQTITGYKVYGRQKDTLRLMATVSAATLTFTDTGSVTPDPASPVNTINRSGQVRGSGIRIVMGENTELNNLAFTSFPDAGVRIAKYDPVTALTGAITTVGQTAITIADGTGLANGRVLRIDDEWVTITAGGGTGSLTVTRGSWGSTAATHANGATVIHQGGGALSDPNASCAPGIVRNLCTYWNRFGLWLDHASGAVLIDGWTGDDDNNQLAITNNTTDPNIAGMGLNVEAVLIKAECSFNASWVAHHPWLYINNGNQCRVDLLSGKINDWSAASLQVEKNVVEIRQGWNGFNGSTCNIKSRNFTIERYQNLLADYISNEVLPWYVGDDFPRFRASGEISYRNQSQLRSELSDPKGALQIVAPTNPMIFLAQRPAVRLSTSVSAAATTFALTGAAAFRNGDTLYIESEQVVVVSGGGTASIVVTRAQGGTTAAAHWAGTWVSNSIENMIVSGQAPTPEGVIAAPPGSLYLPTTPTAGQSAYTKDTGVGNAGWIGLAGWELLSQVNLAGAAATTGALTIPARNQLLIAYRIAGFSASAVGWLRFNADSGQNYWWRVLHSLAGGVTLVNTESGTAATRAQIQFTAPAGIQQSNGLLYVTNFAANPKVVTSAPSFAGTGTAATRGPVVLAAGGEWVNTAAQITQVEVRADTGNLLANSGFAVFGRNA